MKTIEVEITGITPLMHHRMPEEALFGLMAAKQSKNKAKEELTPRDIADKHAYRAEDGTYYIPTEFISGAFKAVASDYKQRNSVRKSIKSVAAGVFRPMEIAATLLNEDGSKISSFEVDVRRGVNHKAGAVAICRPRFDKWRAKTVICVDDSIIAVETAQQILEDAGRRSGIGSFRVSKGGPFGQFRVTSWKEI